MTSDKGAAAQADSASQTGGWGDEDGDDRAPGEVLVVELDGFEGPLDLLLSLARKQKVDLTKVSVLALAEQYLAFIAQVRGMRLEIAADYLVMAAWLAYLKSRLLLPKEEEKSDGPSGAELAAQLAFRLKRLEAMRESLKKILARNKLGVEVFARGMPEGIRTIRSGRYTATLYDLLKAYAEQRRRTTTTPHQAGGRTVWSIGDGRQLLSRLVGPVAEWAPIEQYLADYLPRAEEGRSALASTFGATLELTREGYLELRQATPFGPLHVRWLCEPPREDEDTATPADQTEKIA
ncbi:MAG: segregation and condensation protein A [Dichotomicrobium sp.]